mgnify:CR=1 FL=1
MKKILISAVALFASAMSYAQDWSFDKSHSSVKFSVTHMMVSETAGQFRKFEGSVKPTSADFQNALIDFTIDVNSIDTFIISCSEISRIGKIFSKRIIGKFL